MFEEKFTWLKMLTTSERKIKNVGKVSYVCRKSKHIRPKFFPSKRSQNHVRPQPNHADQELMGP